MAEKLTHLNDRGDAHMVDVSEKSETRREAVAQALVTMRPETLELITQVKIAKGDVFACARIAGIMAAKRTSELIPMCHPVPVESVELEITPEAPSNVRITATAACVYRTGIEMEALTAASIAALTVYDMCKAVDRSMVIGEIMLLKKSGGRSGTFIREL